LYTRLCGASFPRVFPESVPLRPEPSPFSGLTAARVSATTACSELVRPTYGLPCDLPRSTNRMRTTDFCFPLPYLRVPAPRELPVSLRGLRLAHGLRACTRDQETGGSGVSRCLIRFGGLHRVGAWRFLPSALDRVVPLTPLSLLFLPASAFAQPLEPGCQDRCPRLSVKMRQFTRPEVPSIAGGHSCPRMNRFRFRVRSRDVSATVRPSVPFHPRFRMRRFRVAEVPAG